MGFERGVVRDLARAIVRSPALLFEIVRARFAFRELGRLRVSDHYLQWRSFTAYGDRLATASAHDLVYYLEWRREMRSIRKRERVA